MADCIDRGLDQVQAEQETIRDYIADIAEVAATLEPGTASGVDRQEKFQALMARFEQTNDPIRLHMATVMSSFLPGLFVGEGQFDAIRDNLDLERWLSLTQEP